MPNLVYTPDSGYIGGDGFTWIGSDDGTTYAASPAAVSITVASPLAPTVSGFSASVAETGTLSFSSSQFTSNFSDPTAGATLQDIEITSLPAEGTLALSGTALNPGQTIPIGSVSSLVYTPTSGYTGSDSFGWNGSDGTYYAASAAAVNITVASQSTPTVTGFSASVANNATYSFTSSQFTSNFSDPITGASLQTVKITTLPVKGTLALSGTAVTANQAIPIGSVSSLVYTPNSGYTGSDSFGWNGFLTARRTPRQPPA